MNCPREHCGGLMLERVGLDADVPYRQWICSACSRGVTIPLRGPYVDRPERARAPRAVAVPQGNRSPEDIRIRRRKAENNTRAARNARGLCARSGCLNALTPGKTQCQPHLEALATYALARYHRLKQAAKT